eukprot:TRINITY_DN6014_c0_g2_i1.p2 TRINITY_DN6014_c0_g2~~TRINITY_DN6014_c0_g2_i1.p2  ORF type:complete len:435 (+),score=147.16 TRINITY_DN6014_c0_g2_i1:108-1412(+)
MSFAGGLAANPGLMATAAVAGYATPHAGGGHALYIEDGPPGASPKTPSSPPPQGGGGEDLYLVCQKCRRGFRVLPHVKLSKGADDSFRWIEDTFSEGMSPEQLQATASVLYQYAADHVGTNTPLCKECHDDVARGIHDQLKLMGADEAQYECHYRALMEGEGEELGALRGAVGDLEKEEAELEGILAALEAEMRGLEGEAAEAAEARKATHARVDRFWRNTSALRVAEHFLSEELSAVHRQLEITEHSKASAGAANLLNETFNVWHDGHFGTINNLRLGRLPSRPVEQNEMNAAWGYAAQLLDRLLAVWDVVTTRYRVTPKGSFSTVTTVVQPGMKKKEVYELYTGATGLWANTRHDHAIKGFACCVDELCRCVASHCPAQSIPFQQDEDRIHGLSVKQTANGQTEENWTRALKYMLLNLKWAVAMTAVQDADE